MTLYTQELEKDVFVEKEGLLQVPETYEANILWRASVLKRCAQDPALPALFREACKQDILFFINGFCWTLDPRREPKDLPFILYLYEVEYILWLKDHILQGKDCHTDKTRDMGVTWCVLDVIVWCWLFNESFYAHFGSRDEDHVDRLGDITSLFEKMRYLLRRLPSWLLPSGFAPATHSRFMRITAPNGNSITGESANPDFSRGTRANVTFLDEFAYMEYANEIWTGTADATPCRIAVSTPNGTGNKFWDLRFNSDIDQMHLHWTLHPTKSKDAYYLEQGKKILVSSSQQAFALWNKGVKVRSPWYDNEAARRSPQELAQEVDMDYLVSGNPFFDLQAVCTQPKRKPIIGVIAEIDGHFEFREDKNGWARIFEAPERGMEYVVGIDPSEGISSGNYGAAACRNKKTRNLVAGIYVKVDPDRMAKISYLMAGYYNNALCASEAGGYGAGINLDLWNKGANVYRQIDTSKGIKVAREKLGFITNSTSRASMLSDTEAEIRENACELRDPFLISECMNFINKDGKPQASEGAVDDYIMGFSIAGQLLRLRPFKRKKPKLGRFRPYRGGSGY